MLSCTTVPRPADIARNARPGSSVVGWKLDPGERTALLDRFEPRYGKIVADHVTLAAEVAADTPLPDTIAAEAVGYLDDGRGVEALVVAIGGTTDRPDGSTYHVTWSLGPHRQARESNAALASHPWQPFREPVPLSLTATRWP